MGDIHEASVIACIKESKVKWLEIDPLQSYEIQEIDTSSALLRTDIDIIIGAHISGVCEAKLKKHLGDRCKGDDDRVSRPDILVKVGEDSGLAIWAPVDIKSHKAVTTNLSNTVFSSTLSLLDPKSSSPKKGRLNKEDLHQLAHYVYEDL